MTRKDFYLLVQPLTEKLYQYAFALIPDDLQAEQLVIDSMNALLIKEKKALLRKELVITQKKEVGVYRRIVFKALLKHLTAIGIRRSLQLADQVKQSRPQEFAAYYALDPKVRVVLRMRYESLFSVEEITDILQVPRYEVIEKLHNGRFLLSGDMKKALTL